MANSETIKTTIDANINTNGNQAITGAVMNSVLKQMVDSTDAQLTELSEESVKINDTEIPLGNAWNSVSVSLKKGQVIESIGNTGQLILRKEDGSEERIGSAELPYTLTFDAVAVVPTSTATGSKVIVKNLIDSKLNALSSEFNEEIKDRMAIAFEGVTIHIAEKYYLPIKLPVPLKAGMNIERIADATAI